MKYSMEQRTILRDVTNWIFHALRQFSYHLHVKVANRDRNVDIGKRIYRIFPVMSRRDPAHQTSVQILRHGVLRTIHSKYPLHRPQVQHGMHRPRGKSLHATLHQTHIAEV